MLIQPGELSSISLLPHWESFSSPLFSNWNGAMGWPYPAIYSLGSEMDPCIQHLHCC